MPDDEVRNIFSNVKRILHESGTAYVGFCNPEIFNVPESNIEYRYPTGNRYEDNHTYEKVVKNGDFKLIESHRPVDWYKNEYTQAGLKLSDTIFTPEYVLNRHMIRDYIIFEMQR